MNIVSSAELNFISPKRLKFKGIYILTASILLGTIKLFK